MSVFVSGAVSAISHITLRAGSSPVSARSLSHLALTVALAADCAVSSSRQVSASRHRTVPPRQVSASRDRSVPPRQVSASRDRSVPPRQVSASRHRSVPPRQVSASRDRSVPPRQVSASRHRTVSTPASTRWHHWPVSRNTCARVGTRPPCAGVRLPGTLLGLSVYLNIRLHLLFS